MASCIRLLGERDQNGFYSYNSSILLPSSLLVLQSHRTVSQQPVSEMATPGKGIQALVFGASGITGWAITNSALFYPTPTTFSRVVGFTSRPLSLEASGFPSDPRLQLYAGLDLSQDTASIVEYLKKVENIEDITHVYFAGKGISSERYGQG